MAKCVFTVCFLLLLSLEGKVLALSSDSGLPFGIENLSDGQNRGKKKKTEKKSKRLSCFTQELEEGGGRSKKLFRLVSGRIFFVAKWQVRSKG